MTPTRQLQLDYWWTLYALIKERDGIVRPRKPYHRGQHWQGFAIGKNHFELLAYIKIRNSQIGVQLYLTGDDAKTNFNLLHEDKDEIEREIGEPLVWEKLPDKKNSAIYFVMDNCDLADRSTWPELHTWMIEKLEVFHRVFAQRIKDLNAEDYIPDETDLDDTEEENEFARTAISPTANPHFG